MDPQIIHGPTPQHSFACYSACPGHTSFKLEENGLTLLSWGQRLACTTAGKPFPEIDALAFRFSPFLFSPPLLHKCPPWPRSPSGEGNASAD